MKRKIFIEFVGFLGGVAVGGDGQNQACMREETDKFLNSEWKTLVDYFEKDARIAAATYKRPVLLSAEQRWFGGLRHVIMVEPETCATLITVHEQARDYWIRPPRYQLHPGESFTTRVRHVIARAGNVPDLERLWTHFEREVLNG